MPHTATPRTAWSQDAYLEAQRFAAEAHKKQRVPGSDLPYLLHITSVAQEILAAIAVEGMEEPDTGVQTALLHDTLEDTKTRVDDLARRFGLAVAIGVQALTKDPSLPKGEAMADSLRRIKLAPRAVWMVKLADRIINMGEPPAHWTAEKRRAYREEAEMILAELGDASPFLADRLARRIAAYRVQP